MERAQLLAVRLQKGWTREQAAGYLEVDPATIKRWELGTAKPQPLKLQKLCTIYEKTPQELGLAEEEVAQGTQIQCATPEDTTGDAYMAFRNSDLTTRLFRLVWNYSNTTARYHELQMIIMLELEDNEMSNEPITRRDALRRLAMLPIEMGSLSAISAVFKLSFEDILTQCAAGVTACWYLRKGKDLAFASETVSKYLPTLKAITIQGNLQQRKSAADLAAQCCLLKTVLSWSVSIPIDGIGYAQQAAVYSKEAENPLLEIVSLRAEASAQCYANQWGNALQVGLRAKYMLDTTPKGLIPFVAQSYLYAGLATYQAYHRKKQDALTSLRRAESTFFTQPANEAVPLWVDHSIGNLLLNDGLTHGHLDLYKEAENAFTQVQDVHADDVAVPFGCRVEVWIEQAMNEVIRGDQTRDMEQCIDLWTKGIEGAKSTKSNKHINDTQNVYQLMRAAWPGEKRIKALRDLLMQ